MGTTSRSDRRGLRLLAVAAILGTAVAILTGHVLSAPGGGQAGLGAAGTQLESLAVLLALGTFVGVGSLLIWRVTSNPVGWALAGYGLMFSATVLAEDHTARVADGSVGPHFAELAAWLSTWSWALGLILLVLVLLHFPTGTLPSARWRWLRRATAALTVSIVVAMADLWRVRHVLVPVDDVSRYPPVARAIDALEPAPLLLVIASFVSLVARYRRAGPLQRLQVRWLFFAVAGLAVGMLGFILSGGPSTAPLLVRFLVLAGMTGIPVAIGIAVLRYRLYDLDRLVSRTLAYAIVTTTLASVYAGGVLGIGAFLPAGSNDLVVAGTTLVVAALFVPVRQRVQDLVDRRFHRARYDAHRAVEAFAGRLREEVDLVAISEELLAIVRSTVPATRTSLWTPEPRAGN